MPCPKCGIKFERLDTHLRNSATCKNAPTQPSTSTSPTPVDTSSATVPDPSSSQTQAQRPPTSSVTSPVSTLPAMKLPQTPEDWVEADQFFQTAIVPAVLMEVNVDTMNEVLCHILIFHIKAWYHSIQSAPSTLTQAVKKSNCDDKGGN